MEPTTAKASEGHIVDGSEAPAMSLPFALRAIVRRAGHAAALDDLNAALALSWMATAVPDQDNPQVWPLYVRDAFLVPAGSYFGLTIRAVHPPEAARGLSGLAEFSQHFDASYRPLVERALEHDQPVLAWRGWPGDRDLMWGVITGRCDGGVGLTGVTFGPGDGAFEGEAIPLVSPPVQLYVVEAITSPRSDPDGLLDLAMTHARVVLDNGLVDRFGVVTGTAAYGFWLERLRATRLRDAGAIDVAAGFRVLFDAVAALHESGDRFLRGCTRQASPRRQQTVASMTELCQSTVQSLREAAGALDACGGDEAAGARNDVLAAVTMVEKAAAQAGRTLPR